MNPYELLGILPTATTDEIHKAFRSASKQCHPEGESPDLERFHRLNEAKEVLSCPEKRRLYDETGCWKSAQAGEDRADKGLTTIFMGCLKDPDPIGATKRHIIRLQKEAQMSIQNWTEEERNLLKAKARLVFKGTGRNTLGDAIDSQIRMSREQITGANANIAMAARMLKRLKQWDMPAAIIVDPNSVPDGLGWVLEAALNGMPQEDLEEMVYGSHRPQKRQRHTPVSPLGT